MKEVTTDTILDQMKEWVAHHQEVAPHVWLDASAKLNVLLGGETDSLFLLERAVAEEKVEFLADGDSVASATVKVETTETFMLMKQQRAKVKRIEEFIRIAKAQAKLKDNEMVMGV